MEEVLPPQTENGAGFEPTRVRQFTVFMANQVGRLQSLVRAYEQATGQVMALSIQNSVDTALVRIICSDPELAKEVLTREGFSFTEQDVLIVELPKTREPLVALCTALLAAEISIHYVYPMMVRPAGPALAVYVDDPVLAAQLLIKKGFRIIGESDLRQ
jgi:hypothetical protein